MSCFEMAGDQENRAGIGIIRAGTILSAPEVVAGAGTARADVCVTVVPIHAPGLDDAVGIPILAGPPHVIDDPIPALGTARAHFLRDFIQRLFPGDALPFPLTSFS